MEKNEQKYIWACDAINSAVAQLHTETNPKERARIAGMGYMFIKDYNKFVSEYGSRYSLVKPEKIKFLERTCREIFTFKKRKRKLPKEKQIQKVYVYEREKSPILIGEIIPIKHNNP